MDNPYKLKTVFTVHEAAAAIHGIIRVHKDDLPALRSTINELLRAIMPPGELPCTQIQRYTTPSRYRIGEPIPLVRAGTDWMQSTIARADLLAWCESRDIRPALLFPESEKTDQPLHASTPDNDDLSSHHTPALDALHAAIRKFWLHYDPKRPPKSHEIVDWLFNECGMTKTMAESIDRVIRPEIYAKGGNTKLS